MGRAAGAKGEKMMGLKIGGQRGTAAGAKGEKIGCEVEVSAVLLFAGWLTPLPPSPYNIIILPPPLKINKQRACGGGSSGCPTFA